MHRLYEVDADLNLGGGPNKGKSTHATWLKDHVGHDGDTCLIWPFFRIPAPHGRGQLGYMGKMVYAHRLMCIFAHGEPPTAKHQAAHNCGNGHLGCVNPKHLEWKTSSQNQQDRKKHGTQAANCNGPAGKLSFAKAAEIRRLRANGLLLEDLAKRFGVTEGAIRKVCKGESFGRPHKIEPWSADEDDRLRSLLSQRLSIPQAATVLGRTPQAVGVRASRIGAKSIYRRSV